VELILELPLLVLAGPLPYLLGDALSVLVVEGVVDGHKVALHLLNLALNHLDRSKKRFLSCEGSDLHVAELSQGFTKALMLTDLGVEDLC